MIGLRLAVVATLVSVSVVLVADRPAKPQERALREQLIATACRVPTELLERTYNGHRADRSGDIDIIPREPDFVGTGGLPHSGPWDYVGEVPMLWYGPGYIEAQGAISRKVTLADVAPTQGALVDHPFDAPDGTILKEALVPATDRDAAPPRLVVVVVWDGAGRNACWRSGQGRGRGSVA